MERVSLISSDAKLFALEQNTIPSMHFVSNTLCLSSSPIRAPMKVNCAGDL